VFLLSILLLIKSANTFVVNGSEKLSAYERGLEPFIAGSGAFDVHFFIVGVLFIIFGLEVIFSYLWAVKLSTFGFFSMLTFNFFSLLTFLFILSLSFIFELNTVVLDRSSTQVLCNKNPNKIMRGEIKRKKKPKRKLNGDKRSTKRTKPSTLWGKGKAAVYVFTKLFLRRLCYIVLFCNVVVFVVCACLIHLKLLYFGFIWW
jgi:NADH:ubiquinone oxidoreductase subunit 3 (subunit A)